MRRYAVLLTMSGMLAAADLPASFSPWKASLSFPPSGSAFDMKQLNDYDIDKSGFVAVKDGHFYTKAGRIRFCGQNLAFNAMFPTHELAEQMAEHLARQGVNALRVVSIDNVSGNAGWNIWGKYAATQEAFDPDQMEKLDYFFWQLKKRGIYLCFDLHFNRVYPDTPKYKWKTLMPKSLYCKGIDNFMPELIDMQKEFTTKFFSHVNPYTKLAYRDDPQFALVEINNENAFYREMIAGRMLNELPEPIMTVLRGRFAGFLKARYDSFDAFAALWGKRGDGARTALDGIMPLSKENSWQPEITDPAKGTISFTDDGVDIRLSTQEKKGFFNILKTGLAFEKGKAYTVTVTLKAEKGAAFGINAMRQGPPWGYIGLVAKVKVDSSEMKSYSVGFIATVDTKTAEPNYGRITIRDFEGADRFLISAVTIEEGSHAVDALGGAASFDAVPLPSMGNLSSYPAAAQRDLMEFVHALEKKYWKAMRDHARSVGIKAPITGTQLDYTFTDMADVYDYVDIHTYWQHPAFPGSGWDAKNYYVPSFSMVPPSGGESISPSKMLPYRVQGMPFVVSEYDHPFPSDYAGETGPFAGLMTALHDLDGVFFFCFLSTLANLEVPGFFTYYNHFVKSHVMPLTAHLIRSGAVAPFANEVTLGITHDALLTGGILNPSYPNPYAARLPVTAYTGGRFSVVLGKDVLEPTEAMRSLALRPDPRVEWTLISNNVRANHVLLSDRAAKLYIGWSSPEARYTLGNVSLSGVSTEGGYFMFSMFNKNGTVGARGTHIVTLSGKNRYSGLEYLNYDTKAAVGTGDSHGIKMTTRTTAPVQAEYIECVAGAVSLTLDAGVTGASVSALQNGGVTAAVPVLRSGQTISFTGDPKYGTLVYIIEAK
ncbi:MAG: hypothetical protein AABZ39_12490 [Spirochaetota bacterium]